MSKLLNWIKRVIFKVDTRSMLEILKENGLSIGSNCHIMGECIIDPGHCWLIEIGNDVTLAPRVHILAHDASTKRELGYTIIGKVNIGNNVFVGAGSMILPNVNIGDNVVIGAHSVISKDIPSNSVVVGNPAKVIKSYQDYMIEKKLLLESNPTYDYSYTINNITEEKRNQMKQELEEQIGFVL